MVARSWEAATEPASSAGVRVCHLRLGLVLSCNGGLLPPLHRVFRLGLGARLGSGREFWSYISLTDAVRAFRFVASCPRARGPYNVATSHPVRSLQVTRALAGAVGRPAVARMPLLVLRVAVGQMAPEVLGSLRVIPERLAESGFTFEHPDLDAVLHDALASALGPTQHIAVTRWQHAPLPRQGPTSR
jgi:uncharacterized protein